MEELLLASRRGAICVHGRVPYTSRAFAFLGRGAQAYDVSARTRVSSVHPVEPREPERSRDVERRARGVHSRTVRGWPANVDR